MQINTCHPEPQNVVWIFLSYVTQIFLAIAKNALSMGQIYPFNFYAKNH